MTTAAVAPVTLHRHALSGHCHRVELLLSLLGVDYRLADIDLRQGEHKSESFRRKNLFGQIPVLEDGEHVIADSNAILVYLALTYDDDRRWLPRDARDAAEVQRWLSVAAGQLAFGPAAARLVKIFNAPFRPEEVIARAHALLAVIETHLSDRQFLVGTAPTLADVALYAYVARAPEGDVSLADYPQVRAWLGRIEALPRFVPMAVA